MTRNYGLVIDEIQIGQDYILGGYGSLGGTILQPDGNWTAYLPNNEEQFNGKIETLACASFGTLSALEILAKRLYGQSREWSDRFLAKASATTKQGNSPHKVAETLREKGAPNELDWPFPNHISTWEEYYSDIPQRIYDLAIAFISEFAFKHEYVVTQPFYLKQALQYSPVGISVHAWVKGEDGLYYFPEGTVNNHWCVLVDYKDKEYWLVFDSYDPSNLKKVKWDSKFAIAKRYSLNRQVVNEKAWYQFLIDLVKAAFGLKDEPKPEPVTPQPLPPNKPDTPKPTIEQLAEAIKQFEGWYPGSRSFRNANPGNCKYSTKGYAKIYGTVTKDDKGFAVFKTYALGWLYLNNLLKEKCKKNPNWTLQDLINEYAPASDNNEPQVYANYIATRLNIPITYQLHNFA